ncbi:putative membrane protein [Crossiella equi]|uniref:Membrane protein n=1 Tax=Crossiella equi TaxID=130796 RepID=A0ABS5AGR5_9PSEU|nr:hypothetical protein [Crossiella equi]MBP2475770.1 putative membrane protein [Crossiella equi]
MLQILGLILLVWIALSVVGFLVKGLFWLVVVGGVAFAAVSAWAWVKKQNQIR